MAHLEPVAFEGRRNVTNSTASGPAENAPGFTLIMVSSIVAAALR